MTLTILRLTEQRQLRRASLQARQLEGGGGGSVLFLLPRRWVPLSAARFDPNNESPELRHLLQYLFKHRSRNVQCINEAQATLLHDGSSDDPNISSVHSKLNVYVATRGRGSSKYVLFRQHETALKPILRSTGRRSSGVEVIAHDLGGVQNPDGQNTRLEEFLDDLTFARRMDEFRNSLIDGLFVDGHVQFDSRMIQDDGGDDSDSVTDEGGEAAMLEEAAIEGDLLRTWWGWSAEDGQVMWRGTIVESACVLTKNLCSEWTKKVGTVDDHSTYGECRGAPLEQNDGAEGQQALLLPAVPYNLVVRWRS